MSINTDSNQRKELPAMQVKSSPAQVALSPVTSAAEGEATQKNFLGKVATLLQRSVTRSRESSITSEISPTSAHPSPKLPANAGLASPTQASVAAGGRTSTSGSGSADHPKAHKPASFKETKHVSLEYDPKSRRKVLNSYEILREIGRGEHGKVKLARDLVSGELVAIKVMSRKSKDKSLRMRKSLNHDQKFNDYEAKIRREIAIMKRCDHKYIVKFKEVLDDLNSYKIYLVLEYMERGEIIWKRKSHTANHPSYSSELHLPCASDSSDNVYTKYNKPLTSVASEDNDLLSYEFLPNLTFKQSRRVFRDVLLGLEYLHLQGIIHRDIKPANLLVSSDYIVKISDFGVSFASSLDSADDGQYFSDMELAKTVGTPAFFAPELCQTSFSKNSSFVNAESDDATVRSQDSSLPKVDHKIDIWALGVTFYCLLFGRVPFNAESEFALFDVIVHQELEFPDSCSSFNSPQPVSEEEFELAKDLLRKLLDKNSVTRIDIDEIKQHPFVTMDLEENAAELHELFFLNSGLDRSRGFGSQAFSTRSSRCGSTDSAAGIVRRVNLSLSRASNSESSASVEISNPDTDSAPEQKVSVNHSEGTPLGLLPQNVQATQQAARPQMSAGGSAQHSSASIANNNYHLRGRASSIFHEMIDYGDKIRKDSTGSLEAPQIETKRNVGGNLYLKNQSAIDAFKDIQKTDKKQRKSSLYKTQSGSSSGNQKYLRTNERVPSITAHLPHKPSSQSSSKIKVGPISIESGRRQSSVISLPLTESFASLDSLNDDYLSLKYQEHKKKKHVFKLMDEGVSHSDSALQNKQHNTQDISDKFRNFNLGTQMAKKPSGNSFENTDEVEPPSAKLGLKKPLISSLSLSSDSSSTSSDSEEEGNLTLKFSSKVAPARRPPFLSLGNRAQSHDSNLQDLMSPVKKYHDMPFVFQDSLHELEDVPEALMQSNSVEDFSEISPEVSIMAQVVPDIEKVKKLHVTPNHSSPLRMEVSKAPSPNANAPIATTAPKADTQEDNSNPDSQINTGYYNNHYNKDHVRSPFPLSKHFEGDRRSSKSLRKESASRPSYNRSNSITLALLQHERSEYN